MNPHYAGHCVLLVRHAQPARMARKATPAALTVAAHPFGDRGKRGHAINHRGLPKSPVGPCLTRSLLLLVWIDAKLASSGRGARYASPARCRTAGQRHYETQASHTMRTVLMPMERDAGSAIPSRTQRHVLRTGIRARGSTSTKETVGRSSRTASSRRCQTPRPRLIAAPVHIAGTEAVAASLAVARAAAAGTASGTPSSRHGRRRTGTVLGHVAALRRVPSLDRSDTPSPSRCRPRAHQPSSCPSSSSSSPLSCVR